MSNNQFYNNFPGSTFHQSFMPPIFTPPPPPFHLSEFNVLPITHPPNLDELDNNYLKAFEAKALNVNIKAKAKSESISQIRNKLRDLLLSLNELKRQEEILAATVDTCSEEEWKQAIDQVNRYKTSIGDVLSNINTSSLDTLKKLIAKRTAKRLRLRRLRIEKKREKEERIKEWEERSRQIDENLQMIKDAITKAKQEEDSKLEADVILKEVLRKKHNAKKFVSKLDALKKLRNARVNTAKGRGASVSVKDCEEFDGKIDKLKLLWAQKLVVYEKEEEDLRAKLKQDNEMDAEVNKMEEQVAANLKEWRKVLFGDSGWSPQVDFSGDTARFVAVRCEWDQYVSECGTALPVGWVTPASPSQK